MSAWKLAGLCAIALAVPRAAGAANEPDAPAAIAIVAPGGPELARELDDLGLGAIAGPRDAGLVLTYGHGAARRTGIAPLSTLGGGSLEVDGNGARDPEGALDYAIATVARGDFAKRAVVVQGDGDDVRRAVAILAKRAARDGVRLIVTRDLRAGVEAALTATPLAPVAPDVEHRETTAKSPAASARHSTPGSAPSDWPRVASLALLGLAALLGRRASRA